MLAVANDEVYWNKQVRHLAVAWLTKGKPGAPRTREMAITEGVFSGGDRPSASASVGVEIPQGAQVGAANPPGQGRSKTAQLKRKLRSEQSNNGGGGGGKAPKGGSKGKNKSGGKDGKRSRVNHQSDQQGTQLCYSWNFGNGACASVAAGQPCPAGRAHACTTCLSRAHPAKDHS